MPDTALASPEDRYDFLLETGVIVETDDDAVAVSEGYDASRGVYHDTYADASDEMFHATLAELFGFDESEARERADSLGITRGELVAYLTLRSYLNDTAPDVNLSPTDLVQLAGMVADIDPVSPVPNGMVELTDDDYERFLADHDDVVAFVWKRHCAPCDEMKAQLDDIRVVAPDGVPFAGLDGERVDAFRREFDIDAAPATLVFVDGALVEAIEGQRSVDQLTELFADAFDSSPAN